MVIVEEWAEEEGVIELAPVLLVIHEVQVDALLGLHSGADAVHIGGAGLGSLKEATIPSFHLVCRRPMRILL